MLKIRVTQIRLLAKQKNRGISMGRNLNLDVSCAGSSDPLKDLVCKTGDFLFALCFISAPESESVECGVKRYPGDLRRKLS